MNDAPVPAEIAVDPGQFAVDQLAAARRQVMRFESRGDKDTAAGWKRVERCFDYALAMFMSSARIPDPPEEKTETLAQTVLREIAKNGTHDPSRIDAVKLLLHLEGKAAP